MTLDAEDVEFDAALVPKFASLVLINSKTKISYKYFKSFNGLDEISLNLFT